MVKLLEPPNPSTSKAGLKRWGKWALGVALAVFVAGFAIFFGARARDRVAGAIGGATGGNLGVASSGVPMVTGGGS